MLEAIAESLLYVVCCLVGHGVLWGVTFGRWRPSNGYDDFATLVGILYWVAVGVCVWLLFLR